MSKKIDASQFYELEADIDKKSTNFVLGYQRKYLSLNKGSGKYLKMGLKSVTATLMTLTSSPTKPSTSKTSKSKKYKQKISFNSSPKTEYMN